jgi:dTDP-4-amino-4,6-dideoxygalactose transaminase
MSLKNKSRFLSLYFSSIGLKQSLLILLSLFLLPLTNRKKLRSQFHNNFSEIFNGKACFSYSSGRSSLCACLEASGVGEGDEVLLSSFTCLAVPTAVVALGAIPKYCDINPVSLNIDLSLIEQSISKKTKAVVIQHTLGSITSIENVINLLKDRDILIIEDCALSIGSTIKQRLVGTSADVSIFSLELSKTISSGWGGVLLVNNMKLEEKVRKHYKSVKEVRFSKSLRMAIQTLLCGILYIPYIYPLGKYLVALMFKLRFFGPSTPNCELDGKVEDDFICKLPKTLLPLANKQILRFHEITSQHQVNASRIRNKLLELNYSVLGNYLEDDNSISPRVPFMVEDRKVFIDFFMRKGIEIGSWFDGPLSPLPKDKCFYYNKEDYPNASFVANHIVNLPCHVRLNSNDIILIEKTLMQFSKEFPNYSNF